MNNNSNNENSTSISASNIVVTVTDLSKPVRQQASYILLYATQRKVKEIKRKLRLKDRMNKTYFNLPNMATDFSRKSSQTKGKNTGFDREITGH